MARFEPARSILEAASEWRDECLIGDGSMFSEEMLWTEQNVAFLDRYYAKNLNTGEGTFWGKLEAQLDPAPAPAKKLAAEMFWVMYLFVSTDAMKGGTKRLQIKRVWEWSGEPLPYDPRLLGEVLDQGVGHPGTGYNTHRWREFLFFVQFLQSWKRLEIEERRQLVHDAWAFARWMDDMEESAGRQLRHILLYLLFPDQFERIASTKHKRDIVRRFHERWDEQPGEIAALSRADLDRKVLAVRERLSSEYGAQDLDFYTDPLEGLWRGDDQPDPEKRHKTTEPGESQVWCANRFGDKRVWLVSAGEGARLWPEFQREGLIAVGLDDLGDLSDYKSKEDIRAALIESRGAENPFNDTLAGWQFTNEMKEGDWIIAKQGRSVLLGIGTVESEPRHEPGRPEYRNVRDARWAKVGRWPVPRARWVTNKTLTEFTDYHEWLYDFVRLIEDGTPVPEVVEPPAGAGYPMEKALDGLFMDADDFREILDTWGRRKNLILEGPPGVGKTFIAKRLAWRLLDAKDDQRVQMVQFHQSYAYEDFVQGWRPTADRGFELRPGVFYNFAKKAEQDPDNRYVFIIDEINRGNLSRIFGELMMLIEADKRGPDFSVPLTYSGDGETFCVPENLYLLGMMNTADRSLAMVDYALRRRFAFRRMEPAFQSDTFSDYLLDAGVEEPLIHRIEHRMTELNGRIRDDRTNLGPGFEIGHSYFVPTEDDESVDETWYERVIRSEIEPLLKEYWFDRPEEVDSLVARLLQ